jgi:uncharacterized protein YfcZ (UPF0381/DUF406 family)
LLFGERILILKKTQEVMTMKDVVDKCSTKGCAIDVGTIIDNEDCVYRAEKIPEPRRSGVHRSRRSRTCRRRGAASEPPQVDYTIAAAGDEVKLDLPSPSPARRKRSFSNCP